MEFTHKRLIGPKEQIPAMNRVKKILKEGNFSGTVFPFSKGKLTIDVKVRNMKMDLNIYGTWCRVGQ